MGIPIYAEHGESPGLTPDFEKKKVLAHCLPAPSPSPATTPAGISEWYYPVEPGTGLHPRPSDASTLKRYFPEIDDSWSSVWYPSRLGEGLAAVHDRVAGFLSVFVPEVQRRFDGQHKRILLVSHAATAIVLARELVGNRDLSFQVGCCSLTVLDRKVAAAEGDLAPSAAVVVGGWTATLLGDGSHLKEGLQRAWGMEQAVIVDGEVRISYSWNAMLGLPLRTSDFSAGFKRGWRVGDGKRERRACGFTDRAIFQNIIASSTIDHTRTVYQIASDTLCYSHQLFLRAISSQWYSERNICARIAHARVFDRRALTTLFVPHPLEMRRLGMFVLQHGQCAQ